MKATPNQILFAASNILSGWVSQCQELKDAEKYISDAIDLARKMAEEVPTTDDGLESPQEIRRVIIQAFNVIHDDTCTATLLQETIRKVVGLDRTTALAYVQRAEKLGIIGFTPDNRSKAKIYTLKI